MLRLNKVLFFKAQQKHSKVLYKCQDKLMFIFIVIMFQFDLYQDSRVQDQQCVEDLHERYQIEIMVT